LTGQSGFRTVEVPRDTWERKLYPGDENAIKEIPQWVGTPGQNAIRDHAMAEASQKYGKWGIQRTEALFKGITAANMEYDAANMAENLKKIAQANIDWTYQKQVASGSGDFSPIEAVINAVGYLTPEAKKALIAQYQNEFTVDTITNRAIGIGRAEGIAAAAEYLDQSGLPQEAISKIIGQVQQADNQAVEVAKTSALETYDKIRKDGGTIRQAYDAAVTQDISNPETFEARKTSARQKQLYDLSERFSQETNGAALAQLEALREKYKDGGTYDADYHEMEQLQKDHYSKISERINAIHTVALREEERASAKAERTAENTRKNESEMILNEIREAYIQWQKGNMDGRIVYRMIESSIADIPANERRQMESALIAGLDGTGSDAARQFERLDAMLSANAPDKKKASIAEIDAYTLYAQQVRDAIVEARFRGVSGDALKNEVDRILEVETSKIISEAVRKGTIGSTGLFGGAPGTVKEYLWYANQGKLDAYFGERSTQERTFDREGNVITGTKPLTIGGENMERVAAQVNSFGRDYLNKELGQAKITVGEGEMTAGARDERGGNFRYKGSDGNWYRLGVESKNGAFIIEKQTGGNWGKVDIQKLPSYVPPSQNAWMRAQDRR
jgi:hypothetical protein